MANYLYNGIELPALPKDWNQEKYPKICIVMLDPDDIRLYCFSWCTFALKGGVGGSGNEKWCLDFDTTDFWVYEIKNGIWVGSHATALFGTIYVAEVKWANFDLINEDGSIYLPASEPVPVGGSPEPTFVVDPAFMTLGWLIGSRIAAQRGRHPVIPDEPDAPVEPDAPEEPEVPAYTPVEYIQLSGTQYIDTGVICNQNSKLEMTFTREDSGARYLFGVSSSDNKASFTGYQSGVSGGSWRFGAAYGRPSIAENTKITFVMDKNGIKVDGAMRYYNGEVGTFTAPQSLVLGGCNSASGTVGSVRHIGKFYGAKLWDGDTLVRDYIPAINPDGVYGFWEAVTEQFILSPSDVPFGGG